MADWANIYRTAKTHGDFLGRTQAEQDAYFAFFAGSQPGNRGEITTRLRNIWTRLGKYNAARSLRRPPFTVASSETNLSN